MRIFPIGAADLGNQAYLVTDGAAALVVDPPRPPDELLELIRAKGLSLEVVVETHLHNDHVSGGPELAAATGAGYAISAAERVRGATGLEHGQRLTVGELDVEVVDTPGHTAHHQSFVVRHGDGCAVFTGGSLLVGTVGRTDLMGEALAASLAAEQWRSVRHLLTGLPVEASVHPTHGFGSFCSAIPSAGTETTIGAERLRNQAAVLDQAEFVEVLLAGFGEYPTYYAHMADLNRQADSSPRYRRSVPRLRPHELLELSRRLWVVDVRPRVEFARSHVPGSINAGIDGPLAVYLGWTLPWREDFALVGEAEDEIEQARRALSHIGMDYPVGTAVVPAGARTARLRRATFADLAREWTPEITVVDVRRTQEWEAGHLDGARHIPVHELVWADLPAGKLWLHCAAGYRAMLGGSIVRRRGHRDAVVVDDNWSAAAEAGLGVTASAPASAPALAPAPA